MAMELRLSILNDQEQIILALWVCGQTAKQTGVFTKKSNRTVECYRERIKCKLGVFCTTELRRKMLAHPEFVSILNKGISLMLDVA